MCSILAADAHIDDSRHVHLVGVIENISNRVGYIEIGESIFGHSTHHYLCTCSHSVVAVSKVASSRRTGGVGTMILSGVVGSQCADFLRCSVFTSRQCQSVNHWRRACAVVGKIDPDNVVVAIIVEKVDVVEVNAHVNNSHYYPATGVDWTAEAIISIV